jgi:WD40 repeat protein
MKASIARLHKKIKMMKMTQSIQKQFFQIWVWVFCLPFLVACRGGVAPASTVTSTLTVPIVTHPEATVIPSTTMTATRLPTETNTPPPTFTLAPTETPTSTLPAIISAENADKIVQIGKPFPLENLLAEFVFRTDATWVITSENRQQIQIYDITTQKLITTLDDGETLIERLVVSADGRLLATVSPSTERVILWNLDTFEKLGEFSLLGYNSFPALLPSPTGGEFSNDGHYLVIWGCRIPALNYQGISVGCLSSGVIIYDLSEYKILQELNGTQESTSKVIINPNNSILVLVGKGEAILQADLYIWDFQNQQKIATITVGNEFGLTGGKYYLNPPIFVAEKDGKLIFINIDSWKVLAVKSPGPNQLLGRFSISPIAPVLIATDLSGVSIRDLDNERVYHSIEMQAGIIYHLAVSPDGRFIYTISEDGFARKWGIP